MIKFLVLQVRYFVRCLLRLTPPSSFRLSPDDMFWLQPQYFIALY
jgi:hypothetical protein